MTPDQARDDAVPTPSAVDLRLRPPLLLDTGYTFKSPAHSISSGLPELDAPPGSPSLRTAEEGALDTKTRERPEG